MPTVYRIEVGRNPVLRDDLVWYTLLDVVGAICDNRNCIVTEVLDVERVEDVAMLREMVARYERPIQDLTLRVVEIASDGRWVRAIDQFASGEGPEERVKRQCRRAVCRLILRHMHSKGMEVCLSVE